MTSKYKRRRKLILPRLQLRLVGMFLGLLALGLLFQLVLFASTLSVLARELDSSGVFLERSITVLTRTALISSLVVLPLTLLVGIVHTNKIAGPVYRLGRFLDDVASGKRPEDCRLRDGDYLHDFAAKINAATDRLRRGDPDEGEPEARDPDDAGEERRAA